MESRETDDEPYWQRFRRGPIGENEDTNASARILPALSIRGPVVRALLTLTWPLEGVCEHLIGRHRARASWRCPGMTLCRHMWPSLLRGRTTLARSEEPRLNSSHMSISYAVFCLKKKKQKQ